MNFVLNSVFLVAAWIGLSSTVQEKVSDACHGQNHVNKTFNNLQCGTGLTVLVTEVRYYKWKNNTCFYLLSNDIVDDNCCVHEDATCNWTNATEKAQLQEHCLGKMMCRIHSAIAIPVEDRCMGAVHFRFSSIRSVLYQCVQNGSLEYTVFSTQQTKDDTAAPADRLNIATPTVGDDLESNNKQNDVGIIVGSVIGALVVCVLIILAVVFFIRRAKSKVNEPDIHSASTQFAEPKQKNSPVYTSNEEISTTPQPTYTDQQVFPSEDDVSVDYSKVNKSKTTEGDYVDPDNFMPFAHFQPTSEYSHIIRERTSFVTHNDDYDHTTGVSANQEASFYGPEYHVVNPTYDTLNKKNVRVTSVNDIDPYNVLSKERV